MHSDRPIACSLNAAEQPRRLAEMAAIGHFGLLAVDAEQARAALHFRADTRHRLAAIVAAEAECCAFLTMRLEDGPDSVVLTIEAPAGAEAVLDDLVAAFSRSGKPRC